MRDCIENITFTPIEQLFSKEVLERMVSLVRPKTHECHRNSFLLATYFMIYYPTMEYNEGMLNSYTPHAFNSIIVDGIRRYFDITSYINLINYNARREDNGVLLRSYTPGEILNIVKDEDEYSITIEKDGTVAKYQMAEIVTNQENEE